MSKSQRTKGAAFEREVVNIIKEALGEQVKRNLDQWRDGGHEIGRASCRERVFNWV